MSESIDYLLRNAPRLLKKLKRKHGDKLSIGEITSSDPPSTGPADPVWYKRAEILVDGEIIGIYKELQLVDGASPIHEYHKK